MRRYIGKEKILLAACMMAAMISGCTQKNVGNAADNTSGNVAGGKTTSESQTDKETSETDVADGTQAVAGTSCDEESTTEQETWGIADGSYDLDTMNRLRENYEAAAAELIELESGGAFENVRQLQAERKDGDKIVVYSVDDIAVMKAETSDKQTECMLEWGDNSYALEEAKDWSGIPATSMSFIVADLDADGQYELIIASQNGARGSLDFCFIDIVDGEAKCDFYKKPEMTEYNVYNDFLFTYQIEDMAETGVRDVRECLEGDAADYYIGDKGWWNEDGHLLENPYITFLMGCTYEYDFYNDIRDGGEGCIIRIGSDMNFSALSGPCFEVYSYYKFSDGKIELIGRR